MVRSVSLVRFQDKISLCLGKDLREIGQRLTLNLGDVSWTTQRAQWADGERWSSSSASYWGEGKISPKSNLEAIVSTCESSSPGSTFPSMGSHLSCQQRQCALGYLMQFCSNAVGCWYSCAAEHAGDGNEVSCGGWSVALHYFD